MSQIIESAFHSLCKAVAAYDGVTTISIRSDSDDARGIPGPAFAVLSTGTGPTAFASLLTSSCTSDGDRADTSPGPLPRPRLSCGVF